MSRPADHRLTRPRAPDRDGGAVRLREPGEVLAASDAEALGELVEVADFLKGGRSQAADMVHPSGQIVWADLASP